MFRPPTDNLYKFFALSGVAIFALGVVMAHQYVFKTDKEVFELRERIFQQETNVKIEEMKYDLHEIVMDGQLKKMDEEINGSSFDLSRASQAMNIVEEKAEMLRSIFRSHGKMQSDFDKFENIEAIFEYVTLLYLLVAGVGLFFALLGFGFWYWNTQRHLDAKLLHDVSQLTMKKQKPSESRVNFASASKIRQITRIWRRKVNM